MSSTLNDQTSPKTICSQLVPFSAYNFLTSPSSHLHALVPVPLSISSSYRPPPRSTFSPTQLGPVGITSLALTLSPPLPLPPLTPTMPTYGSIYFYLAQNSGTTMFNFSLCFTPVWQILLTDFGSAYSFLDLHLLKALTPLLSPSFDHFQVNGLATHSAEETSHHSCTEARKLGTVLDSFPFLNAISSQLLFRVILKSLIDRGIKNI